MGKSLSEIYDQGRDAAMLGLRAFMCPYPNGTEAQRTWLRGYYAAAHRLAS